MENHESDVQLRMAIAMARLLKVKPEQLAKEILNEKENAKFITEMTISAIKNGFSKLFDKEQKKNDRSRDSKRN